MRSFSTSNSRVVNTGANYPWITDWRARAITPQALRTIVRPVKSLRVCR